MHAAGSRGLHLTDAQAPVRLTDDVLDRIEAIPGIGHTRPTGEFRRPWGGPGPQTVGGDPHRLARGQQVREMVIRGADELPMESEAATRAANLDRVAEEDALANIRPPRAPRERVAIEDRARRGPEGMLKGASKAQLHEVADALREPWPRTMPVGDLRQAVAAALTRSDMSIPQMVEFLRRHGVTVTAGMLAGLGAAGAASEQPAAQ